MPYLYALGTRPLAQNVTAWECAACVAFTQLSPKCNPFLIDFCPAAGLH